MKTKLLLKKLSDFFDADQRAQVAEINSIKKVLKKLKKKEKQLETDLEQEQDSDKREKLELKLSVCRAQRKKGEQVMQQLAEQL
ncbi:MAG: hypothetical protein R3240_14160 [Gammaproteobacteria bacterium]|nr:hypothetical protein [Gammaproteobacteria bacterium]